MKPIKYSSHRADKIDLGTKAIFKYPTPTKRFDVAKMVLNGRHPKGKDTFVLEHDCSFVMFITKGTGRVFAGSEVFDVVPEDVVFVPSENKFAVEGNLEYITFDIPAYYKEQSEEIKVQGK